MDKEQLAIIALNSICELEPIKISKLIEYFGSAYNVLLANTKYLETEFKLTSNLCSKIKKVSNLEFSKQEIDLANKNSIEIVLYNQQNYPKQLKNIYNAPLVLYVKGKLLEKDNLSVSVVGTRRPTNYGLSITEIFCKYFAQNNITTISGLARGIDAQTHKTTLKNSGRTIAVLGNGLLQYYPAENKKLQDEISNNGVLISEFSLNQRALPINFPRRNRIVAALSKATIVVESAIKSGSLITAKLACEYGKDVFAVPGPINSKYSQGPNDLIKQGAFVITEPEDILYVMPELYSLLQKQNTKSSKTLIPLFILISSKDIPLVEDCIIFKIFILSFERS